MKVTILFIKFLFIGALFIVSTQNLHLSDKAELDTFIGLYNGWLSGIFDNFKYISSYVVKSEWLPGNSSEERFKFIGNSDIFENS